jgi:hypothetical protein
MSSKSRKVVERGDQQAEELESHRRLRAELARSSTTLRRAPQASEDTIEAIEASLEAALAQLDNLEQPRRMPPPLPKMPPPLPRAQPAPTMHATPVASTPVSVAAARTVTAAQPRRSNWRRWLVATLLLTAASGTALRVALPDHPAWRALEHVPAPWR